MVVPAIRRHRGWWRTALACGVAFALVACNAEPARAGVTWHSELAAAKAASAASRKPVLAVFTATWSPESTAVEQQVLVAPEVEALLNACFEPVRVDVDQRPGLVKRLEVAHVPSAYVLDGGTAILARFDCPTTPTAFVAAAARAAQDAAAAQAARPAGTEMPLTQSLVTDEPMTAAPAAATGSISLVTEKVRQLSDFATATDAPAQALPAAAGQQQPNPFAAAVVDPPVLPRTAPANWPSEPAGRATAFTAAPEQPMTVQPIEPRSTATPWLAAAPPAAPAAPASAAAPFAAPAAAPAVAAPESSAGVTDSAKKPTSASWSGFVAAFQKPFGVFTKPAKSAEPATMPAARPTSPLAAATPAAGAPVAAEAAVPDAYGSMPLGLEGYCPVTLAERGVWAEGRGQWGVRHRGRTYLFAGPEQQQAFLASPDRFAPALSGDDPVAVVDQGRSLPGRRAYGVTYQSRMYLFASPETRAQFAANPERYTATAMLAERPAPVDATRRY